MAEKLDKSTPDSTWKKVLSAQQVGRCCVVAVSSAAGECVGRVWLGVCWLLFVKSRRDMLSAGLMRMHAQEAFGAVVGLRPFSVHGRMHAA